MYAIFDLGGKQHKVSVGDVIQVDKLGDKQQGDQIEFDRVLYVSDEKDIQVGTPLLDKAKVVAEIVGDVKGRKGCCFFLSSS